MSRVVRFVAAAALIVAGVVTGNPYLIVQGASIGSSALKGTPRAPRASAEQLNRLLATIDPRTPRKMVLGRTAMATDIRDQEFTDNQTYLHRFIVVASHKVHEISEIWFEDKLAWTLAGGVQGEFVNYLEVTPILEGNAGNAINISARMGTTRRYTGLAYVHLRYRLIGITKKAESPFAQNVPQRITIVGDGAFVYDPRLDSTVPGGSGPCRADDQSTWIWNDDASRNPALQLVWFLLGWRINGKLAVGKGIPPNRINWPAVITAANICDEAVSLAAGGTEPRYRADGVYSEGQRPTDILDALKTAMNAELDDLDGKIRPFILRNDLAVPQWSFTADDIIGEFTWEPFTPLDESFNIVRGTYPDPSTNSLYQFLDYPEVAIASPDGLDRIDAFDLGNVQSVSQCQRLARMRLRRNQFGGIFRATFQATAWKVEKGSVVSGTFAPAGFAGKKFRVASMDIREDGLVPLELREEDASIYSWAAEDEPGIAPVAGATFDPAQSALVVAISGASSTAQVAAETIGITAQIQTTAAISFALDPGASKAILAQIKVDALSGSCTQEISVQWRIAGGTYATLGAVESHSGGTGDTVFPSADRTLTNSGSAPVLYEVRAVANETGANTGTVDLSKSFIRA